MKKSKYRAKGGAMKGTKYKSMGGGMKSTKYMSRGGAALKSEQKANPSMGNIPASVKKALAGSAIGFGVGSKNLLRANKAKKSSL
jgi:hypothetical protein